MTWQARFDFFYPRFGEIAEKEISSNQIVFDEQSRVLSFSYSVKNFSKLVSSGQRVEFFNISPRVFGAFLEGGTISIPDNVKITLFFPSNAQVDSSSFSSGFNFFDNKLTLSALKINSISIDYSIVKSIISFDNTSFFSFRDAYIILLVAVLLFLVVQTQKDTLEKKFEGFIVKHSEIKKKIDDDLDL